MNVSAVSAFLVYYCHKLVLRMYTLYINVKNLDKTHSTWSVSWRCVKVLRQSG